MTLNSLRQEAMDTLIAIEAKQSVNPVDGLNLSIICDHVSGVVERQIYEPLCCIVLQGSKEIAIGPRRIVMQPGDVLIVSHGVPVATRVLQGTPELPYLALVTRLDIPSIQSVHFQVGTAWAKPPSPTSIEVGQADEPLIDAMRRLLALRSDAIEASVLEPMIHHEISFRLLQSQHGGTLRELMRIDSYAGRIAKAVRHIQDNYEERLTIESLASLSAMAPSTFHKHFKAVIGHSPVQYQKMLRLLEARRLLEQSDVSVTEAALAVGYLSANQFSRDFARAFEISPRECRS